MNYLYKSISDFGSRDYSPINNPLTYCIGNNMDQRFLHGGNADIYGNGSEQCQLFMADYCASEWDDFCEIESRNNSKSFPAHIQGCIDIGESCGGTAGESLIANTASRKYLVKMHYAHEKYEPFDPTVANSPMIRYWVSDCGRYAVPEYAVDPENIDQDIVMDKILENPKIAMNILINIYNTMKRYGTLSKLRKTKLGQFYNLHPYFKSKGGVSE
jgi:hypothetical protein